MTTQTINETDWLGDVTASPGRNPGGRPAIDYRGYQRKLVCDSCGFIAYATAGALTRAGGFPTCACGQPLVLANLRDRAVYEWDKLEAELQALGVDAWNEAMREIGALDLVKRAPRDRRGGAVQKRCEVHGCNRFSGARFCHEHEAHQPEVTATHRRVGRL
jgi:hypothetical protein